MSHLSNQEGAKTIDAFNERFEFIPQNDLEWLAVNAIIRDGFYYKRDKERWVGVPKCDATPSFYSYLSIKECRYELGLDERPEGKAKEFHVKGGNVEMKEDNKLKFNPFVLKAMRFFDDGLMFTKDEMKQNYDAAAVDADACAADVAAYDDVAYAYVDVACAYAAAAAAYAAAYDDVAAATQCVDKYFDHSGENKTDYYAEVKRLKGGGKLKLTKDDDYLLMNGDTAKAVYQSDQETCMKLTSGDCKDTLFTVGNRDLKACDRDVHYWDIVKLHNPLAWMDKLPDSRLFDVKHEHIFMCDETGKWNVGTRFEIRVEMMDDSEFLSGDFTELLFVKMPTLTGDQWKRSKLKIENGEWVHCG